MYNDRKTCGGLIHLNKRIEILPNVFLRAVKSHKFKTGCFSVNFVRPLSREEATGNALVPCMLLRASQKYPSITAISNRLDEMYGASVGPLIRKRGEVQTVGLFADFIEDCFAPEPVFAQVAEFVQELLLHPVASNGSFPADTVEGEKQNLRFMLQSRLDDKQAYIRQQLLAAMCQAEAYRVPRLGEEQDVGSITPQGLYEQYLRILKNSRIEVFYMGRQEEQEAAEALTRMLRPIVREQVVSPETQVVRRAETVRRFSEQLDIAQGKLAMGLRTDCTGRDSEYPALMLLNVIFGGGSSSKLFLNVREKRSLCYYAGSGLDTHKGIMVVSAGVDSANLETAEAAILKELEDCKQGKITVEELSMAKRAIFDSVRSIQDSPASLDDFYLSRALNPTMPDLQELQAAVEALEVSDVAAAANRLTLDTVYTLKGADA